MSSKQAHPASNSDSFWIRHLLRRAGFGFTPDELERYRSLGYEGTLSELLHPENVDNSWLEHDIRQQGFDFTNIADLKRWWIYRMAFTARPLEEKMTLFWHGHFATSERKVKHAYAMYAQNLLLRKLALGNFHQLLHDISKDPAMIMWLDNQQNRKGKPNENYAREIMELFTMGIGNYSEQDVKEAARAFTGWQTGPTGFRFNADQHDFGHKQVLGVSGNLNGDDVVRILVGQHATARHLARKLIKFFVYENPSDEYVNRIASVYLKNNYNIAKVVQSVFASPEFLSQEAYHAKIKSPSELVVGTVKTLQLRRLDAELPVIMARMGQNLFEPPSVKGWDGGPAWIATDTMMERFNFAARITSARMNELAQTVTPSQLMRKQGITSWQSMVDYLLLLLVDGDVPAGVRKRLIDYASSDTGGKPVERIADERVLDTKLRGLVHLIMTLPTYQLA